MSEQIPTGPEPERSLDQGRVVLKSAPLLPDVARVDCLIDEDGRPETLEDGAGVRWVDFRGGDFDALKKEGFKNAGVATYLISPIGKEDLFSDHYANCTGIVAFGRDASTGEEVAFLSHQNPDYFVDGSAREEEQFSKDLSDSLEELKKRAQAGTIEVVLFGGTLNDADRDENYQHYHYRESIKLLRKIVQETLGFDPKVVAGPNNNESGLEVEVETAKRKIWIRRDKQPSEFEESYQANELEEKEKQWGYSPDEHLPRPAKSIEDRFPTVIPFDKRVESGPEIVRFNELIAPYETTESLATLDAISDFNPFNPEDVAKYPLRQAAKSALAAVDKLIENIQETTNSTPETLSELRKRRNRLSAAIGIVNNKKVDHTRG